MSVHIPVDFILTSAVERLIKFFCCKYDTLFWLGNAKCKIFYRMSDIFIEKEVGANEFV